MIALSVNLNKIALLRNSRGGNLPDLLEHAETCIGAGCKGITVHPRPDQRHIRPEDTLALADMLNNRGEVEFNIEGNPFAGKEGRYPGFLALVLESRPDQCTLVPDGRQQLTSDHGFDLGKDADALLPIIDQLHEAGIRVSLFMDADTRQIELASRIGADRIELYTGPFAAAFARSPEHAAAVYMRHVEAAHTANDLGLGVNAGHDLNLENLLLYRQLPYLREVSIGHALVVDAIARGLVPTVQAYLRILHG